MQGELGYHDTVLEPLLTDVYRARPADPAVIWNQPTLHFVRTDNRVTGLFYNTDRTRRLPFARID